MRVKVNCRDPSAIRCVIEIFFNKVGHEVKFISEGSSRKSLDPKGGPPELAKRMTSLTEETNGTQKALKGRRKLANLTELAILIGNRTLAMGGAKMLWNTMSWI